MYCDGAGRPVTLLCSAILVVSVVGVNSVWCADARHARPTTSVALRVHATLPFAYRLGRVSRRRHHARGSAHRLPCCCRCTWLTRLPGSGHRLPSCSRRRVPCSSRLSRNSRLPRSSRLPRRSRLPNSRSRLPNSRSRLPRSSGSRSGSRRGGGRRRRCHRRLRVREQVGVRVRSTEVADAGGGIWAHGAAGPWCVWRLANDVAGRVVVADVRLDGALPEQRTRVHAAAERRRVAMDELRVMLALLTAAALAAAWVIVVLLSAPLLERSVDGHGWPTPGDVLTVRAGWRPV